MKFPFSILKRTLFVIATILLLIIIYIIFASVTEPIIAPEPQHYCTDINTLTSIEYAACFDAFTQMLFFEIRNTNFISPDTTVTLNFFDYVNQGYTFEIPQSDSSLYQRIPAQINPLSAEIYLKNNQNLYCATPKTIEVSFCPPDLSKSQNGSLELISKADIDDFKDITHQQNDRIQEDLVDPDRIWQSICKSNWQCESWGSCINNIQKRECVDTNQCGIPTYTPQRVRTCDVSCTENWQCEWSRCENGFTTPTCIDQNACGTQINKPNPIPCTQRCEPDIVCGDWQDCEADYDFLTLVDGNYVLSGIQKRECVDQNGCIATTFDSQDCSLTIDITTKELVKCGKSYVSLYNRLDGTFIANIEKNNQDAIVNIDLSSDKALLYCDYCFDGILNGDEDQIDCGGSCQSCDVLRVNRDFSKGFFERVFDGIRKFLS